jgi:flagellar basal body P-ring protein FlgI
MIRSAPTLRVCLGLTVLTLALALIACNNTRTVDRAPGAAPPPTYTGPPFLRNTIGSLCTLVGFEPSYVSGIGVVVNLNGTGSAQVPAPLKTRIEQELRKRGVGSMRSRDTGFPLVTPGQLLDSEDTAVVAVQGLIPAGATQNTHFDILVSALPQTQTSSLQGGQLMPLDLTAAGAESPGTFLPTLATARGDIYLNPFDDASIPVQDNSFLRQGIVLRGGRVAEDQRIELTLNQPSWARSRTIANRINERFGLTSDRRAIAEPKTDRTIAIFIPPRYADDPQELIGLISYVYLGGGPDFEEVMANQLADIARRRPDDRRDVQMAWKALGKQVVPVLRPLYEADDADLAFAALAAGAFHGDELTTDRLERLADADRPDRRIAVARILADLPNSLRGSRILGRLVDDPDPTVRVAAYEALISTGDSLVRRLPIVDETGRIKYVVDRVRSDTPLVYARITSRPTLAIFSDDVAFDTGSVARAWDNRVMVRATADNAPWEVFYAPREGAEPSTYQVYPSYPTLAYFLGHRPSNRDPQDGLDLSFSRVVDVLYEFSQRQHVNAPMRFELSGLAAAIGIYEQQAQQRAAPRPETDADAFPTELDASPDSAPDPSPTSADPAAPLASQPPAGDRLPQAVNPAFPRAPAGRPESNR